jgi:hypothetical protein
MTAFQVRVAGSPPLVLRAVTELAESTGIELTSSEQPVADGARTSLDVTVHGSFDDVADAVATIRGRLTGETTIEIMGGSG